MAKIPEEVDTGGVNYISQRRISRRIPTQKFAAGHSNGRIDFRGRHQLGDEVAAQNDIRVEKKNPIPLGLAKSLILGGSKTSIRFIEENSVSSSKI